MMKSKNLMKKRVSLTHFNYQNFIIKSSIYLLLILKLALHADPNIIYYIVVQVIIQLGNEILRNLGVEDPIDDVAVFFR
jgi:hypothetical protein